MGKSKKGAGKHKARRPHLPIRDVVSEESIGNLFSNLNSIDETKRIESCVLIANVFLNSDNPAFSTFASEKNLSALAMRLIDDSESLAVRTHAAGAFRNMAAFRDPILSQQIFDFGIFASLIDVSGRALGNLSAEYVEFNEVILILPITKSIMTTKYNPNKMFTFCSNS